MSRTSKTTEDQEFDRDSLDDESVSDSDMDQCISSDFDHEVPESPILSTNEKEFDDSTSNSCDLNGKLSNKRIMTTISSGSNSATTRAKCLPTVMLTKNMYNSNDNEKVLDYRKLISTQKVDKNFVRMKFKDFKRVKKASSITNNKVPNSISKDNFVEQNMHKIKRTLHMLNKCVETIESKHKIKAEAAKFVNTRSSVEANFSAVLVNQTSNSLHFVESEDSLDSSPTETVGDSFDRSSSCNEHAMEHDDQDEEEEEQQLLDSVPAKGLKFVYPRPSVPFNGKLTLNSDSELNDLENDSLEEEEQEQKQSDYKVVQPSSNLKSNINNNIKKDSTKPLEDGKQIKLKFFKRKENVSNLVTDYNNEMNKMDYESSSHPRVLHSPVRKKKDRKQLLAFICKQCQDYYVTRDLTEEKLKKLVQRCSRHRGQHHLPYCSPKKFWDTDFISSTSHTDYDDDKK